MKQTALYIVIIMCLVVLRPVFVMAGAIETSPVDETMLMLVGETEMVTTVASRQPESPAVAPAMVTVVGREEIERHGYQTLAELLAGQPGFFMAAGGRGTAPYLRGLRDSILFLYDGVPITTDVTKGFAPLDHEVSLAAVDRIEIVRGPGSVLWGPDAFAGVVNIVPRRGGRQSEAETALAAGTENRYRGSASWGGQAGRTNAFIAVSEGQSLFFPSDYTVRQDDGTYAFNSVPSSRATELAGTLDYGGWLHVTGHWADCNRFYTMRDAVSGISWPGEKEAPFNLMKVTAGKIVGPSHYTLSGFVQELDYRVQDADIERSQSNLVNQLELLWDRRLFTRGLLTAGASWKRNQVDGALVRDGFLPDYLAPENTLFLPRVDQKDYRNELTSSFSQFRYQWGGAEWWLGGRLDDYSQYHSTLSYSLGFNRSLGGDFRIKGVYGNAFRSPYSSQLFNNTSFEPESITTVSTQFIWSPEIRREVELTLYSSQLTDHIVEDPYGGLSLPASHDYQGLELSAFTGLGQFLDLRGGFSYVHGNGEEKFRALRYSYLRPDGSSVSVYDAWAEPLDQGPGWMIRLGLDWRVAPGHTILLSGQTGGSVDFSYDEGAEEGSYTTPFLLDLVYRGPGLLPGHDGFTLKITNLLDRDYLVPDIYGPVKGAPFQAILEWRYRF